MADDDRDTKAQALYQDHPNGTEFCLRCSMYRIPGTCTAVKGTISPRGWCRHFERK